MDSDKSTKSYYSQLIEKIDIDKMTNIIDQNVKTFRYIPYVVGAVGLFVTFRAVRLATKFTSTAKVPKSFIRKNVTLRGRIENVCLDGTLQIDHMPILRMPWHRFMQNKFLEAKLAFITPTTPGVYWTQINVGKEPIKFRLLDRKNDTLMITVKTRLPKIKSSLNEELVKKGMASVDYTETKSTKKFESKLIKNLHKCENKAKKDGVGMWENLDDNSTSWTRKLSKKLSNLNNYVLNRNKAQQ